MRLVGNDIISEVTMNDLTEPFPIHMIGRSRSCMIA